MGSLAWAPTLRRRKSTRELKHIVCVSCIESAIVSQRYHQRWQGDYDPAPRRLDVWCVHVAGCISYGTALTSIADSAESFNMIRGGHMDVTCLGVRNSIFLESCL